RPMAKARNRGMARSSACLVSNESPELPTLTVGYPFTRKFVEQLRKAGWQRLVHNFLKKCPQLPAKMTAQVSVQAMSVDFVARLFRRGTHKDFRRCAGISGHNVHRPHDVDHDCAYWSL